MTQGRSKAEPDAKSFARAWHDPSPTRAYTAATVIRAQKRVITMAVNTIGRMSARQLRMLRPCGDSGLITLNELTAHLVAAWHLKVRPETRQAGR